MKTIAASWLAWKLIHIIPFMFATVHLHAQIRWDGEASDGLWNSPLNWVGDAIPSATDEVLLDNSVVSGNYMVTLPSGTVTVSVRTLIVKPAAGIAIQVVLPPGNTAIPGFVASGATYGLEIHRGGVFTNSSGASAGSAVDVSDSIKIHNGGLYKHNTSRAHANNIMVLSRTPGTEQGSFEFDVPGGAGYTISIAGRVYGSMILSATAAGGTKSYTSTGTTSVQLNGEFRMNQGASYSLNFNGNFNILGDFIHQGNVLDISSGSNNNVVFFRGNFVQSGTIAESGTGTPVIEFGGNGMQNISSSGNLTGNLMFRINNAAGVRLLSDFQVSHHLQLVNGLVKTTPGTVLILADNATCAGGSGISFVEGTIRKIGDDDFEFPTGKQGEYAPIRISGTGTISDVFEAEYFLGNPSTTFGAMFEDPPIVRISSLEYWRLERVSGTSQKKVTLSVRTYSDATLLEKLVVTRWDAISGFWKNEANTSFSGVAAGDITSQNVNSFGAFTVASTVSTQNPLPSEVLDFSVDYRNSAALLRWSIASDFEVASFEILKSIDMNRFEKISTITAEPGKLEYHFPEADLSAGNQYYQIRVIGRNGKVTYSVVRLLFLPKMKTAATILSAGMISDRIQLLIKTSKTDELELLLFDVQGKTIQKFSVSVIEGRNRVLLNTRRFLPGIYYLVGVIGRTKTNTIKLRKL